MSTGMPELGSKISLISKADIRYEGRLFTVDPQQCTIALANVRSFGTEDRESSFPVAPQNQVYDYILFRGSDIKDIRVVNNVGPLPNDPAIVQLSVPPSLAPSAYQNPGFSHAVLGHLGPGGLGQYPGQAAEAAAAYATLNNLSGIPPGTSLAPGLGVPRGNAVTAVSKQQTQQQLSELSPTLQMPQQPSQVPVPTKDQASVLDLIGGSRSSTATPVPGVTRKSPTIDQGVQVSSSRNKDGGIDSQQQQKKGQQWHQQHHQQQQQQHSAWEGRQGNWGQQQYVAPQPQRTQRQGGQGGGWKGGQSQGGGGGGGSGTGGNTSAGAGIRRGRGRGGGGSGQGFANRNQQQQSKNKNVLKFEGDYDFEQANEEFAELRSQLGKMKLNASAVTPSTTSETVAPTAVPVPVTTAVSPKVNGEDKKDDSGNETGIGEGETEEDSDVIFYDRTKSFFDNISCEAVERSKGHSQRTDWRQERKLNSETFGVASARRGGYRGRGYYGNRGMGNVFGRGGYRGYRGGSQNNRGRGNYGGWGSSQQAVSNNATATGNVSK